MTNSERYCWSYEIVDTLHGTSRIRTNEKEIKKMTEIEVAFSLPNIWEMDNENNA